jgi:hypothetical protein
MKCFIGDIFRHVALSTLRQDQLELINKEQSHRHDSDSYSYTDFTYHGHNFQHVWIQGIIIRIYADVEHKDLGYRVLVDDGTGSMVRLWRLTYTPHFLSHIGVICAYLPYLVQSSGGVNREIRYDPQPRLMLVPRSDTGTCTEPLCLGLEIICSYKG